MINFDSLILKLFAEENTAFFEGAKIQKIRQPNRFELIFYIRKARENRKLYININPNCCHICFMSKENEARRNISFPKSAPMFCMLLRKYIQNAKILKISVPKYERIFEIYFEYSDELNKKSQLCLAVELMGKYGNIILYNYDTNIIIGCAHNVGADKSRERELCGMLPYVYPAKQKKKDLLYTNFTSFQNGLDMNNIAKSVSEKYYYLTIPFVQDLAKSIQPFSVQVLYKNLVHILKDKNYSFCIADDYSKYYVIDFKNTFLCSSVNEMIDEYFSFHQSRQLISSLKSKIFKYINNRLKKLENLKSKQIEQSEKFGKVLLYKNFADLIMTNQYSLKQGLKQVLLPDFEGNQVKIDLDENLSPIENANKYYSLYKKEKSACEHSMLMSEETKSQILYFEEMKFFAQNCRDMNGLNEIYNEITSENDTKEDKSPIIDFIEFEGSKIYIGKNKKQNDYILSKLSSAEDIWFHALNAPGAHILVKMNNSKDKISENLLLKAALITKEYSAQKYNSKTSVIYTKRKYVKKANKKQAFVTYKNETEIII